MSIINGKDIALLKKLSRTNSSNTNIFSPVFPCTLIRRLKQLCPDWDDITLQESWQVLVDQGFAKDMPLKVTGNYGQLNNADDFLTDKGRKAASEL